VVNNIIPSTGHLEWADCEVGVIIHYDMQVYEPGYQFRSDFDYQPPTTLFNPQHLDTNQWLETAVALGAKYAVLVAKHCSGFSLWPTKAHEYSVASSPWKNGQGDVVMDFINSCNKYGVRPGLYASCGCNAYLKVDRNRIVENHDHGQWEQYKNIVLTQLRELWSNYGELFEIWFDGGNLPSDMGGKEITDLLCELQPNAIVFQGDPERMNTVRWIGNERSVAPYPCYSRANLCTESDGVNEGEFKECYYGSSEGKYWCPGEADMPNRDQVYAYQGGWFWQPDEEAYLYSPRELLDRYYTSVGRNCNFLLGMVIDDRGLVPDADVKQMTELGELIKKQYSCCIGKTSGEGLIFDISFDASRHVNMICVMEDIAHGDTVSYFTVSGFDGEKYHTLESGKSIGHKFLSRIHSVCYSSYRLSIHNYILDQSPRIREFSLWNID